MNTRNFYRIVDRGADWVLTHHNGFEQQCANAMRLARAIAHAESIGQEMDPTDSETVRCVKLALDAADYATGQR